MVSSCEGAHGFGRSEVNSHLFGGNRVRKARYESSVQSRCNGSSADGDCTGSQTTYRSAT